FSDAEPTDADLTATAEALADLAASWPELARGGPARPDPAGSQGRYPTDTPGEHPWSGSSGSPSPAHAPGSSGSPSPPPAPGSPRPPRRPRFLRFTQPRRRSRFLRFTHFPARE